MDADENKIEIIARDPENQLPAMLEYIRRIAGIGHSFEVEVDPESREYTKKFFMDGDGSFHIMDVKVNGKKVNIDKNAKMIKENKKIDPLTKIILNKK
jgi:hypothetical protein